MTDYFPLKSTETRKVCNFRKFFFLFFISGLIFYAYLITDNGKLDIIREMLKIEKEIVVLEKMVTEKINLEENSVIKLKNFKDVENQMKLADGKQIFFIESHLEGKRVLNKPRITCR